jgi:hypothetical protein
LSEDQELLEDPIEENESDNNAVMMMPRPLREDQELSEDPIEEDESEHGSAVTTTARPSPISALLMEGGKELTAAAALALGLPASTPVLQERAPKVSVFGQVVTRTTNDDDDNDDDDNTKRKAAEDDDGKSTNNSAAAGSVSKGFTIPDYGKKKSKKKKKRKKNEEEKEGAAA